ncbi:MAG TPA: zinc-dependent peptidase [Myxococcota bacterium]|nr:zinc-dependent peptidase [Myxococcota bacterium]HRY94182.1 zinc-dependent peptidase [Myxococcota bacterium]HSA20506.1 zinc-dependent peptidase [Myxococcota bacterium]
MAGPFTWLRRRRLRKRPFPEAWRAILASRVPFAAALKPADRARFEELLKLFAWEKHFLGMGGLVVEDDHRVTISAAAVRLALHVGLGPYDRLSEILVYPGAYTHPDGQAALGEAHAWGTVVLSWQAVVQGLQNQADGHETATHEFAHALDRADGGFDGTPELGLFAAYAPWARVMSQHYLRLRARKAPERKVLRAYGATNEAEFFAVATEAFFEKPRQLERHLPELYDLLRDYYQQDPSQAS